MKVQQNETSKRGRPQGGVADPGKADQHRNAHPAGVGRPKHSRREVGRVLPAPDTTERVCQVFSFNAGDAWLQSAQPGARCRWTGPTFALIGRYRLG